MDENGEVTTELYVRSLCPTGGRGRQRAVVDRLRDLRDRGQIDELRVRVWGERIGLSTTAVRTEAGTALLDRIGAFRSWAAENGRQIEPFFETRETASEITGEEYTVLVLPTMVLAEYANEQLRHVAPCRITDANEVSQAGTGRICGIDDRLTSLGRTGSVESETVGTESVAPARSSLTE
jgi:hypothetical protein